MASAPSRRVFGSKSAPHTIVFARGDKIRHCTVRPWVLATVGGFAGLTMLASVGLSAAYLFNDHIVASLVAREMRVTTAYEERMATLRNEIDRLKTGQTIVRETVAAQVEHLLKEQAELSDRFQQLQPLMEKARDMGVLPSPSQNAAAGPDATDPATSPMRHGELGKIEEDIGSLPLRHAEVSRIADLVLPAIRRSVDMVSDEQAFTVAELARTTQQRADRIADALGTIGIRADEMTAAMGGPYIPVAGELSFRESLRQLDQALAVYDSLKTRSERLPLADPLPGAPLSSTFGVRPDPFLRRPALHSGIDFAAPTGTPVRATASGRVVSAGDAGGYGLMVEIEHGDGLSSRYAHMSAIAVSVGQTVSAGDLVGRVGSTGRSTGAHLHYEVRTDGSAVDPQPYIRAGRKMANL